MDARPQLLPEVLSQPLPVLRAGDLAVGYRLGQSGPDLRERKSGLLAYPDHGDPAQHIPAVAPLVPGGAVGADQPLSFVEPQSRRPRAASFGDLAHGQPGLMPVVGIHRAPVGRGMQATGLRISPLTSTLVEVLASIPASCTGRLPGHGGVIMIVVVGGTGRVGRQVVTQLTEGGRPVRSVSRGLNPGRLPPGAP